MSDSPAGLPATAWRVVAASVRGTAHEATDLPCQDAHAWREQADGTLLVAVADGAGSARRSDEGAALAVQACLAALEATLAEGRPVDREAWGNLLMAAMHAARAAVSALAEAMDAPLREFATTLTCAVAGGGWLAVAQNGDGAVVVEGAGGALRTLVRPRRGEYANEVAFLTSPDGLDHVTLAVEPSPPAALLLTTDGLVRLALDLPAFEPHAPFFDPLLAFARSPAAPTDGDLAAFLASERVCARTDDDKTLVVAVRRPAEVDAADRAVVDRAAG